MLRWIAKEILRHIQYYVLLLMAAIVFFFDFFILVICTSLTAGTFAMYYCVREAVLEKREKEEEEHCSS